MLSLCFWCGNSSVDSRQGQTTDVGRTGRSTVAGVPKQSFPITPRIAKWVTKRKNWNKKIKKAIHPFPIHYRGTTFCIELNTARTSKWWVPFFSWPTAIEMAHIFMAMELTLDEDGFVWVWWCPGYVHGQQGCGVEVMRKASNCWSACFCSVWLVMRRLLNK